MEYSKLDIIELVLAMVLVAVAVAWCTVAFISIDQAVSLIGGH